MPTDSSLTAQNSELFYLLLFYTYIALRPFFFPSIFVIPVLFLSFLSTGLNLPEEMSPLGFPPTHKHA